MGGSTPDGADRTNRLSRLFVEAATNLALPEPLVWIRWHPRIDQAFFDFCLSRLPRSTCYPMMWSDKAIPAALMELGIAREDAFNYVPVGCNELAVPGQWYYNPGAHVNYLQAIEAALTDGKGYKGQWKWDRVAPPISPSWCSFGITASARMRGLVLLPLMPVFFSSAPRLTPGIPFSTMNAVKCSPSTLANVM